MLTREQRDKWAEELESGRWKQCRLTLANDEGAHCCLGVFCVAVLGLSDQQIAGDDSLIYRRVDEALEGTRRSRFIFTNWNDRCGKSFPEIAKHVRALPVSDEES